MSRFVTHTAPACRQRPRRRQPRPPSLASLALTDPSEYGLRLRPPMFASGHSSRGLALEGHAHRVGCRGVQGQDLLQGDLVLPAGTDVVLVADLDLAAEGLTDPDVLFFPGLFQAEGRVTVVTAANSERGQVVAIPSNAEQATAVSLSDWQPLEKAPVEVRATLALDLTREDAVKAERFLPNPSARRASARHWLGTTSNSCAR
jgi:hypothetical protein